MSITKYYFFTSGVFLPYTGVKTDIIYATKVNQKIKKSEKRKDFWYFDVKSDGYTLDNHRRKLDTPSDISKYEEYRKLDSEQVEEMLKVGFEVVPLDKVRENSYILVGSRYRTVSSQSKYEIVEFSEIATLTRGINYQKPQQTTYRTNNIILPADNITLSGELNIVKEIYVDETVKLADEKRLKADDIFICMSSGSKEHIGKVAYIADDTKYYAGGFMGIIRTNSNRCLSKYLFFYLLVSKKYREEIKLLTQGANINNISSTINSIKIPLPSIDIQQQIVDELEGYRNIINGASKIVNNYKTNIQINPEWELKFLGDLSSFEYGYTDNATDNGEVRYIRITDINNDGTLSDSEKKYISLNSENSKYLLNEDDILVARIGATYGKTMIFDKEYQAIFASYLIRVKLNDEILPKYYFYYTQSEHYWKQARVLVTGAGQPQFNANTMKLIKVPVPSIEEQRRIIEQCDRERELIKPTANIIDLFMKKIENTMNEIWSK